jgi:hypothetical protein
MPKMGGFFGKISPHAAKFFKFFGIGAKVASQFQSCNFLPRVVADRRSRSIPQRR